MMRIIWATLLVGAFALAQEPARLEFEVASVKPAAPPAGPGRGGLMGIRGGPGTNDPTRLQYNGLPLKMLIVNAYDVKPYQISGPGWLDSFDARYDVVAKVPEGTTKEQARSMLQNLLAERFKLKIRHETKDLPLYELTVAKNGPKLKSSVEDPNAPKPGDAPLAPPTIGKDGLPQLPAGRKGLFIMMRPGGSMHMVANVTSMSDFANMLGNNLGSAVIDKTGLTGTYDFAVDYAMEPGQGPFAGFPPPPPPPGGGVGAGTGGVGAGPGPGPVGAAPQNDLPNIFTAVQEQLGLKLSKTRGPLDLIVVEHAERTPTED